MFAEFPRLLARSGHLLLAFQVGNEPRHLARAFGHLVSLDSYRFQPDHIAELLHATGLAVHTQLVREPDETERVQQAYVLARKLTTMGDINHVR